MRALALRPYIPWWAKEAFIVASDLREFMAILEQSGDLKVHSEPVHWDLEASAIAAMSNRVGGPAIHFAKVKGYDDSYTLAGSLFAGPDLVSGKKRRPWSRMAAALDLDPGIGFEEFQKTLWERKRDTIRAILVDSGPCKEEIHAGDDIDVLEFPIPRLHVGDAGRYGTMSVVITPQPQGGRVNWGLYRWQVVDSCSLLHGRLSPRVFSHFYLSYCAWKQQNRPMPFAIVVGGPPAVLVAAAYNAPGGTDDAALAGGLMRNPVELVKCETNDLLVPANAEIVIEGEVLPDQSALEGPFTGFVDMTDPAPAPLYRIKAITHRKSPILPFSNQAKVSDSLVLLSQMHSLELYDYCIADGYPIRWVQLPVETKMALCVVSTYTHVYAGIPFQVSRTLFAGSPWFEKVLILDADVNADDIVMIINDMYQKTHPRRGYRISDEDRRPGLVANYPTENGLTSQMHIDTTWRVDRPKITIPKRTTFEECYPQEVQQKVLANWKSYGFKQEPVVYKKANA